MSLYQIDNKIQNFEVKDIQKYTGLGNSGARSVLYKLEEICLVKAPEFSGRKKDVWVFHPARIEDWMGDEVAKTLHTFRVSQK